MGIVCEVAVNGEHADAEIEVAFVEAKRVEQMLSTWIADSELSRVNRGEAPGEELHALLDLTAEWTKKTNGTFDPRYMDCGGNAAAFQTRAEYAGSAPHASDSKAEALPPHSKCHDPGAWGKGYALDRMLALTTGDARIDFGGQLIVRGEHEVAIANPRIATSPFSRSR
jgi:thiamine biosynthesis lipoprotein ApbE